MSTKYIANQVHKQASRLSRYNLLNVNPVWLQPVMDHPPLPLPARESAPRTEYDTRPGKPTTRPADSKTIRPFDISYVEDQFRRQFFRDHPFEAFRRTSLVEGAAVEPEHPIRGVQWTRLRQRGRNPSPEDAVRYAANLHQHHGVGLSAAYESAVAQFRALRAELSVARSVALHEAGHNGTIFGPSLIEQNFEQEDQAFEKSRQELERDNAQDEGKKWKAVYKRDGPPDQWTKGQEYTRLWKRGVRPMYSSIVDAPHQPSS
ncbi:mitochondrial ribosomal protein S25-domain-containing protein [Epithele typhae]|uniref:mitochondrial ribosomal protein S25-domain-containing protein n=1 Tax=Epithele typhae TaxID=378194 RepID=UPI0020072493|nr:mitochondrial ribosomal protein S25-domain-containing protein [Epithele typhae]KAH9944177.1 mitochondrial ribosomal protein S25-domain-containing protein [Epithele typhae]